MGKGKKNKSFMKRKNGKADILGEKFMNPIQSYKYYSFLPPFSAFVGKLKLLSAKFAYFTLLYMN